MRDAKESDKLRAADPWCRCGHRKSVHTKPPVPDDSQKRAMCGIVIKERPCGCWGWEHDRILNATGD